MFGLYFLLFPLFLSYWKQPIVLRNIPSLVVKSKWRWKVILLPFTRFLGVLWATWTSWLEGVVLSGHALGPPSLMAWGCSWLSLTAPEPRASLNPLICQMGVTTAPTSSRLNWLRAWSVLCKCQLSLVFRGVEWGRITWGRRKAILLFRKLRVCQRTCQRIRGVRFFFRWNPRPSLIPLSHFFLTQAEWKCCEIWKGPQTMTIKFLTPIISLPSRHSLSREQACHPGGSRGWWSGWPSPQAKHYQSPDAHCSREGLLRSIGVGAAASIFFRKLLGTFYTTGFENYCLITNVQKKHLFSSWLMLLTFDSSGERRKQQGCCVCPRTPRACVCRCVVPGACSTHTHTRLSRCEPFSCPHEAFSTTSACSFPSLGF